MKKIYKKALLLLIPPIITGLVSFYEAPTSDGVVKWEINFHAHASAVKTNVVKTTQTGMQKQAKK